MPIYEYICGDCETRYERLVLSANRKRVACPQCGSKKATQHYSTFSTGNGNSGSSKRRASSKSACACTPRSCGCH